MFGFLKRLVRRFQAIRHIRLEGEDALFLFHQDVQIIAEEGSEIRVNRGLVKIGYPLPGTDTYASFGKSYIHLGKNSRMIFDGHTLIAPGSTIRVKEGATLRFGGRHHIAHNLTLICSRQVLLGENSLLSWGVTLIDDDEHFFANRKGRLFKAFYRPLILEKNVALQMNVMIPRGVTIGENSIVSSGSVVRKDVPANSLAYLDLELRVRSGIACPQQPEASARIDS